MNHSSGIAFAAQRKVHPCLCAEIIEVGSCARIPALRQPWRQLALCFRSGSGPYHQQRSGDRL